MVHRARIRMRQRGIVVQMERENKEGEGRKKETLFSSITAVLFDGRDIAVLIAVRKDRFFSRSSIFSYSHFSS